MKFDQVVWITGASSGIGEALAYAFARAGARLILSARRESELQRVRKSCGVEDSRIFVLPLDLADPASLADPIRKALDAFGGVDILVNNAGVSHWTKVRDLSEEVVRTIFETNFFGGVRLTQAVLPQMVARRRGSVVVISSVLGKMAVGKQAAYIASKHALQGFYDTLRLEVAREGIQVLLVCPGFVRTDVARNSLNQAGKPIGQNNEKILQGLDPAYVAQAVLVAIERGRHEIVVAGRAERFALWLKRVLPAFYFSLMSKRRLW